jgi:hypothetical protein
MDCLSSNVISTQSKNLTVSGLTQTREALKTLIQIAKLYYKVNIVVSEVLTCEASWRIQ